MAEADVQGMLVRIEATTAQMRQEIARGEASVAQAADKIDSSLGKVDKAFDRTEANASLLQKAISSAFTGIGIAAAASAAGLVAITVKTTEYAQEIKNLAALSNTSVSNFQRLAAGAKTVGIEQDKLSDILKDTNDRVGEFIQRGGGEMADFFKEIAPRVGVTAQQFAKLSGPEALQLYYNSLEKAGLNQQQMTTYMEAMADEATGLIPLLKNNGAGFQQFGDQAERTGRILSDFQVDRLVQSNVAIKNLEGSFDGAARQLVVGLLPSIESVTQRLTTMSDNSALETLGSAVGFLVEHFNVLAVVMGAKVAASFANYVSGLASSTVASAAARTANIAQAASAVEAALANQQAAQTAVFRAEKEAAAARGTAVQTQLSLQLAEARMVERNATAQAVTAQAGLKAASGGVLALLGGPAGLAALAVGAGIAFLTMGGNAKAAGASLEDLKRPIAELRKEFQALTKDQQQATIVTALRQQEQAADEAGDAYSDFLKTTRQVLGSTVGTRIAGEFETARNSGQGFSDTLDDIQKRFHVPEEGMRSLREAAGQVSTLDVKTGQLKDRVSAYRQEMGATVKPTDDKAQADRVANEAANKYLGTLDQQLTKLKDKTAVEQANTFITANKIPAEGALAAKILERAKALDAQKDADKKATEATNAATSATKKAASEDEARRKALTDLQAQADIAIKSATGLAAAYLSGIDKSREFTLQQKVEEALLKTGASARAEVTSKIKAQMDAQDRLAVSKAAYDLGKETSDLLAQAKATLLGGAALEQYNVQKAMQVALAGRNIELGSREYQQLLDATSAQQEAVKVARQAADAGSIIDRLYPSSKLLRDYTEDQAALTRAMELYPERADAYRDALQRLGLEYQQNQQAASAWGKFTEGAVDRIDGAFADMWKNILGKSGDFFSSFKDGFRQFLAEMLHMALTKPIIVQIGASLGLGTAAAQSSGLFGATGGAAPGIGGIFNNLSSAFSLGTSGFGKAVGAGWSSGDGILGGLQSAYNGGAGYLGSLFGSGGAAVGTGSTAAGYTSQAFSGWVGSQNALAYSVSGLTQALSGIGGAIYGYGQSGVKGAVAGGLGGWGGSLAGGAAGSAAGAALGGTLGSILPGVGTVIGAALGSYLGGSLFGGSWQTKDQGISLGVADGDLSALQFQYQKKKGGLLSSNKKRTRYSALDSDTQSALDDSYAATTGAVFDLFDKLNVTLNDGVLDGLNVAATQISTKGKTAEQIQEEITKWFAGVADSVTSAINTATGTGLDGYNFEALTAFVNNLYGVNDVFTTLNLKLYDSSVSGGKLAERLSAMAGGLANLQAAAATYYDNFYTDTEKANNVLEAVRKQFGGLDITFPDTREAFRHVVDGLDRTTEAGQQMFVTLTSLSGSAASAYTILEQRAAEAKATQQAALDAAQAANANYYDLFTTDAEKAADKLIGVRAEFKALGVELPATRQAFMEMIYAAQQGAVAGKATASALIGLATDADAAYKILQSALMQGATDAFSALQRSISAQQKVATAAYNARVTSLNDMLSTVNTSVSDLTSLSSSLGSALKSLSGTSDDAVKMLRAQAQATLQSALATARAGGSLASFSGLADALDTVGSNNTDLYTSLEEFNRDQGRTANVVAELNLLNGKQLTNAEKSVKALQDQLDQAKKAYDAQSAQFDAELAFAQAQLDMLNGLDTSVMTVTAAVNALNAAVVAALKGGVGSGASMSPSSAVTAIQTAYRDILGREADAPGLAAWTGALANGASLEQVLASIKASAAANGQLAGHATGGYISGPGTGTSDSILARLSNGEYVLKAAAVRAFGTDALDQMNSLQIPAFATGGPVLDISSPSQVFSRPATASGAQAQGGGRLEQKVDTLIDVVKQIVGPMKIDSGKVRKLLEHWDGDGLPKTTTASASE